MKDRFGHLENDDGKKSAEEELTDGTERLDDQYSEKFKEAQEKVLNNIQDEETIDRTSEKRRDTDIEKYSVDHGITDIDRAITHELKENFNFHVKQNNKRIKVPVIWDNQERWAWARQRRNLKSIKDKVLLPLIVIERTDVSNHPSHTTRTAITRLNSVGRTLTVRQRYSKKNRYDQFTVKQGLQPEREYYVTEVPDWQQVTYNLTIFTEYMWQMDKMTDMLSYWDKDYWGNHEEGKLYYTRVKSISQSVEMADEARYIQADMSLEVDGFIAPEQGKRKETEVVKGFSPSNIRISEEVVDPDQI